MSQVKRSKNQPQTRIDNMSTSIGTTTVLSSTPQSTKKRKSVGETPETSKKRRKHAKVDSEVLTSEADPISTPKKEKRKKRKDKVENVQEDVSATQETQDIELPDLPEQVLSLKPPVSEDDAPLTNGTDVLELIDETQDFDDTLMQSKEPSCFYKKRLSLQVPIPAISLETPTTSLLSLHLAPLLLSYFQPAEGIVLSFSDPVLSAKPSAGVNLPLQPPRSGIIPRAPAGDTFARCADAFGVCWVWLTATFLVFRPQRGDELKGWRNVASEGFVGLVCYNYFQTAIGKSRIPKTWIWDGATMESNKKKIRKGKLRDEGNIRTSQTEVANSQDKPNGHDRVEHGSETFIDADGNEISAAQTLKVVDIEMVPGHEKDRWTLQIDGSLLSPEEEAGVVAEEQQRFEQVNSRIRSRTPGVESGGILLTGGDVPFSQQGSSS